MAKWTQEEDRRLLEIISENAGNLRQAFRLFTEEYPRRTLNAVGFRWYGVLRLRNDTNVCLITIDKKHKHINGKNSSIISKPCKSTTSLWRKILKLFNK